MSFDTQLRREMAEERKRGRSALKELIANTGSKNEAELILDKFSAADPDKYFDPIEGVTESQEELCRAFFESRDAISNIKRHKTANALTLEKYAPVVELDSAEAASGAAEC